MAHPRRFDADGRYFHVMNRGIAHRSVFERRADVRYFLSRLAKAVRRGEIEVLAYCILTTHFHMLVRSHGRLSPALRRTQTDFVRRFNRSNDRDGPLFRGRFLSKPVDTRTYLCNAYVYVLENAVDAGLAASPHEYPWCSAGALERRRPPPLARGGAHRAVGTSGPRRARVPRAGAGPS
jgi:REP-associated tyrosine transposase